MNTVKISIITATYNSEETLTDCFESIKSQDYVNYEHIIIDGASSDGTIGIINKYSNNNSKFISEEDDGIYCALNKGIAKAEGDVIGILNSDDIYYDSRTLSTIAQKFSDPSICAVYGDLEYVSRRNTLKTIRYWRSKPFKYRYIFLGWMPPHPTLFVRKEWYIKINGFDKNLKISGDYLSILKLFMDKKFTSIYIPRTLIKMRIGGVSNKSIANIIEKIQEDWYAMKSVGFSHKQAFIAVIFKNLLKINQFFIKNDGY